MSKKEKTSDEVKETVTEKKQRYDLTDAVLAQGYSATVDGRLFKIGFDLNFEGKKNNAYASVMESIDNPARGGGKLWKWTGITYLEDLTDKQLWVLAIAKVILLNKEQEKIFKSKFYS